MTSDDTRPRRRIRLATSALAAAPMLLGLFVAGPADARPAGLPLPYQSTITVTPPATGTIYSNIVNGNRFECRADGSGTCSITDFQVSSDGRPTTGWPEYEFAGARNGSGWALHLSSSNADCHGDVICTVPNSAQNSTVEAFWSDVQAPTFTSLDVPAKSGPGTRLVVDATDNEGITSIDWAICSPLGGCAHRTNVYSTDLADLPSGKYTITVTVRDAAGNGASSTAETVLDKEAPSIVITDPADATTVNTKSLPVQFSVQDANPATTVCKLDGQGDFCTSPWVATGLTVGTHTISLTSTDGAGNTSTVQRTITVAPATITASASPAIVYGYDYLLTARGLPASAGRWYEFRDHSTHALLCSAPLDHGQGTCTASGAALAPGSHRVDVTYAGDANTFPATGGLTYVVKARTALTGTAAPATGRYGSTHPLQFGGLPAGATGSVRFLAGTRTLCTAVVSGTGGTCAAAADLAPGGYSIVASYRGDTRNAASDSTPFRLTVEKGRTVLRAAAAPTSVAVGTPVTLTGSRLPVTATGTVLFTANGRTLCVGTVKGGTAQCSSPTTLAAGSYAVSATYRGNTYWETSTASTSFTVTK